MHPLFVDASSGSPLTPAGISKSALGIEGLGCAIAIASASVMTESVKGKTVAEAHALRVAAAAGDQLVTTA